MRRKIITLVVIALIAIGAIAAPMLIDGSTDIMISGPGLGSGDGGG